MLGGFEKRLWLWSTPSHLIESNEVAVLSFGVHGKPAHGMTKQYRKAFLLCAIEMSLNMDMDME